MNYRWRAPKRDNDKAWARIAVGDWLWELHPKRDEWDGPIGEKERRRNPKFGVTPLFDSIEEKFANFRIRRRRRYL